MTDWAEVNFNLETQVSLIEEIVSRPIANFIDDDYMADYNYQQITDPFTFEATDYTVEA